MWTIERWKEKGDPWLLRPGDERIIREAGIEELRLIEKAVHSRDVEQRKRAIYVFHKFKHPQPQRLRDALWRIFDSEEDARVRYYIVFATLFQCGFDSANCEMGSRYFLGEGDVLTKAMLACLVLSDNDDDLYQNAKAWSLGAVKDRLDTPVATISDEHWYDVLTICLAIEYSTKRDVELSRLRDSVLGSPTTPRWVKSHFYELKGLLAV